MNCILFDNFAQIFWDIFFKFSRIQKESTSISSSENSFISSAEKKHFIQMYYEFRTDEVTDSWEFSQEVKSSRKRENVSKNYVMILMRRIV